MCWRKHLPILRCECTEKAEALAEKAKVKQQLESVRLRIDTMERESEARRHRPAT